VWGDDEGPSDGTVDASTSGQVMFKPHQPKQRVRQKKATEAGPRKSHLLAVDQPPVHYVVVREMSALCVVPPPPRASPATSCQGSMQRRN
jgi:hypothetical protein